MDHWLWLLPAAPHQTQLQELIDRAAARFGGQPFLPHLTVGTFAERPRLAKLERSISRSPLHFSAKGVASADHWSLAAYFIFATHPRLDALRAKLPELRVRSGLPPHLSVWYGTAAPVRAELLKLLHEFPLSGITFDRFALVEAAPLEEPWRLVWQSERKLK